MMKMKLHARDSKACERSNYLMSEILDWADSAGIEALRNIETLLDELFHDLYLEGFRQGVKQCKEVRQ